MATPSSWASYNSAGYITTLNSTLGSLKVGQVVRDWRAPDLTGMSPVTRDVPTVIDAKSINTYCNNFSTEDKTFVWETLGTLSNGIWYHEEELNYEISTREERFNKSVYWLSQGGSLWNGGVFLASTGENVFFMGALQGKYETVTENVDPYTGEPYTSYTYRYMIHTLTLNSAEYIYFSQQWWRDSTTQDAPRIVPPFAVPSGIGDFANTILVSWGSYPIPFWTGTATEDTSGSSVTVSWEEHRLPIGAITRSQFYNMYLTNYTDFVGFPLNVSVQTWLRVPQYRADGHTFGFGYLATRPELASNQRWVSGDDIWTPTEESDSNGTGQGGAPGSPAGGGYHPEALDGDETGIPALPSMDVASSKLCGVYNLDSTGLTALTNWLWSSNFFDSILKNFNSPMENIVSFGIIPFNGFSYVASNVVIGNLTSEVSANRLTRTMYELDCGTLDVVMPYESYGSFEPFSTYSLYLPFIGIVDLPSDDVAPRTVGGSLEWGKVNVVYHFDVFSGACVCYVRTCTNRKWNVLGQYSGNLLTSIPISQTNFLQVYQTLISTRANISSMGANAVSALLSPTPTGMVSGAGGIAQQAGDTANQLIGIRPSYARTGTLSNVHGLLGKKKPYLIKHTARIHTTNQHRDQMGYVSNLPVSIGSLRGYVQTNVSNTKISGIARATDNELNEIKSLLGMGIYI